MIVLHEVLDVKGLAQLDRLLATAPYEDGRVTSALPTKRNRQVVLDSAEAQEAGTFVLERLSSHAAFRIAAHAEAMSQPLFSVYEPGMEYPDHVDVALMGGLRTDIAVTLFLSPLESYSGGELVSEGATGRREIRLDPGDAILYPASTVHHVAPVTRGRRRAAVLWIQSYVSAPERRQLLYELGTAMAELEGTHCGALVQRSYWNLLRMWAKPAQTVAE